MKTMMMTTTMKRTLAACLALAILLPLGATQSLAQVETLDDLIDETRKARSDEAAANAAREKEFIANRDQRKQMVAEAQAAWDAATKRNLDLSTRFDANEAQLSELETTLKAREGNLGELFGVTRQVAGDSAAAIYNSSTSGQFPGRDQFFMRLAKAKSLPTITELEDLSFELMREIVETGRVARFRTDVVMADGSSQDSEVVRIGGFIAMSGDQYLVYEPTIGKFKMLPRQPAPELRELAANVTQATTGYVEGAIDPSRGPLLTLYTQRPDLWERIEKGEEVGYVILTVGALGALCAIYQLVYLIGVRRRVTRQLSSLDNPVRDNPLGRVLSTFRGDPARVEDDVEVIELRISEAVLREVPTLERFQGFLRLAVAAGPLLGLVGTVLGMIITFQSITESGSSDPKLMAAGIGQAMIATVLGLGIAIPLLFANAGLSSLSKSIVQVLDEQSNGLLAEHIERKLGETAASGGRYA